MSVEDLSTLRFNSLGTWSPRTAEEAHELRCFVCGCDLRKLKGVLDRPYQVTEMARAGFESGFCSDCVVLFQDFKKGMPYEPYAIALFQKVQKMFVAIAEVCTKRGMGAAPAYARALLDEIEHRSEPPAVRVSEQDMQALQTPGAVVYLCRRYEHDA